MRYLKLLANWRIMAITALAVLAVAMLAGDTDDIRTLVCSKAAGIIIGYMTFRLAEAWKEKMPELDIFREP